MTLSIQPGISPPRYPHTRAGSHRSGEAQPQFAGMTDWVKTGAQKATESARSGVFNFIKGTGLFLLTDIFLAVLTPVMIPLAIGGVVISKLAGLHFDKKTQGFVLHTNPDGVQFNKGVNTIKRWVRKASRALYSPLTAFSNPRKHHKAYGRGWEKQAPVLKWIRQTLRGKAKYTLPRLGYNNVLNHFFTLVGKLMEFPALQAFFKVPKGIWGTTVHLAGVGLFIAANVVLRRFKSLRFVADFLNSVDRLPLIGKYIGRYFKFTPWSPRAAAHAAASEFAGSAANAAAGAVNNIKFGAKGA